MLDLVLVAINIEFPEVVSTCMTTEYCFARQVEPDINMSAPHNTVIIMREIYVDKRVLDIMVVAFAVRGMFFMME